MLRVSPKMLYRKTPSISLRSKIAAGRCMLRYADKYRTWRTTWTRFYLASDPMSRLKFEQMLL